MTATLIRPKKASLALALLLIVVLCSVAVAHAQATISSASTLKGTVTYSLDNFDDGKWSTTLTPNGPFAPWYSRLEISSNDYNGPVTITWKLQKQTGFSSWTDVSGAEMLTSIVLTENNQNIFASNDGTYSPNNYDWGQYVAASGTYRVVATVMA